MHRVAIAALRTVRAAGASRAYPLLAGGAAAVCVAAELLPIGPPRASLAFCEQQPCDECEQAPNATDEPASYPYAPPKQDDPEANALVLASWRAKITEARELFAKLDYAGAERALQLALYRRRTKAKSVSLGYSPTKQKKTSSGTRLPIPVLSVVKTPLLFYSAPLCIHI